MDKQKFDRNIYIVKRLLNFDVSLGDYIFIKTGYRHYIKSNQKINKLGKLIKIADTRTFGMFDQYKKIICVPRSEVRSDTEFLSIFLFTLKVGNEEIQARSYELEL